MSEGWRLGNALGELEGTWLGSGDVLGAMDGCVLGLELGLLDGERLGS